MLENKGTITKIIRDNDGSTKVCLSLDCCSKDSKGNITNVYFMSDEDVLNSLESFKGKLAKLFTTTGEKTDEKQIENITNGVSKMIADKYFDKKCCAFSANQEFDFNINYDISLDKKYSFVIDFENNEITQITEAKF